MLRRVMAMSSSLDFASANADAVVHRVGAYMHNGSQYGVSACIEAAPLSRQVCRRACESSAGPYKPQADPLAGSHKNRVERVWVLKHPWSCYMYSLRRRVVSSSPSFA